MFWIRLSFFFKILNCVQGLVTVFFSFLHSENFVKEKAECRVEFTVKSAALASASTPKQVTFGFFAGIFHQLQCNISTHYNNQ